MPPTPAIDACTDALVWRWLAYCSLRGDPIRESDGSQNEELGFGCLDADTLVLIAIALPSVSTGSKVCLDGRRPGLLALASTCRFARASLKGALEAERSKHKVRLQQMSQTCMMLGTTFEALRSAGASFAAPESGACAECEARMPKGCLFARTHTQSLSDVFPAGHTLPAGNSYCAHCWRKSFTLMARPLALPEIQPMEQTWEEEIDYDDGGWRLVQDFSGWELDSPLLAREEYSDAFEFASELNLQLMIDGYILKGKGARIIGHGGDILDHVDAPRGHQFHEWALHEVRLLGDLLSSGYAEHLLAVDMSLGGLDDQSLEILANGLVGHALHLQFLDLSYNPISDDGMCMFANLLSPRCFELMLPLLRWLHWACENDEGRLGQRGLHALGSALQASALPSLELLWLTSDAVQAAAHAPQEELQLPGDDAPHVGAAVLFRACESRGIALEVDEQGLEWVS